MYTYSLILILLICITYIVAQDPIVTITETEPLSHKGVVMAIQNKDVTFNCHVENLPKDYKVSWQKHNYNATLRKTFVSMISKGTSLIDNTKYGIEIPVPNYWRLRLRRIVVSDAANYTCKVLVTRRSFISETLELRVNIPPYIIAEATSFDRTVEAGKPTELKCQGSGLPNPVIEWSRLGNALLPIGTERYRGKELRLKNVQSADRGIYRCRVWNTVGTVTRDITLRVQFKPEIQAKSRVIQAVGYRIELQCVVKANPYPHKMSWSANGQSFDEFDNVGRFQIHSVTGAFNHLTYELIIENVLTEDYGDFKCKFENTIGSSEKIISLQKTTVPQKSFKLGRIMKASSNICTASIAFILITTMLTIIL